jgi:hypothetical protein
MTTRTLGLIAAAAVITALSGCASSGGAASGQPSGNVTMDTAPAAPASAAAAPSPAGPCTTRACIASDAQKSLVGLVDEENSVVTKASCKAAAVKQASPGIWTATCTATYSDGTVARGIATLLAATEKITWEATDIISDGSGD